MATKRPRYMISVDDEMYNAIEDFRFENRFQTRSEATAELIRLGLETLKNNSKKDTSLKTKVEKLQPAPQKTLEEMSLGELNIEAKKEEIEYIKSSSNSAGKTTSFVSNTTADTQKKSKNINTNDKVSNQ